MTKNGTINVGNNEILAPSLMFVAAIDLLLCKMKLSIPSKLIQEIKAISGSTQQHGTIYWLNTEFFKACFNVSSN